MPTTDGMEVPLLSILIPYQPPPITSSKTKSAINRFRLTRFEVLRLIAPLLLSVFIAGASNFPVGMKFGSVKLFTRLTIVLPILTSGRFGLRLTRGVSTGRSRSKRS